MMDMPMPMWFYTSTDVYFLLQQCETQNVGGLILGCFVSFIFAFSLPSLTFAKTRIIGSTNSLKELPNQSPSPAIEPKEAKKRKSTFRKRLLLTITTGFQYGIAGLVMLLIMTYNVWVFVSIVAGYTISYFHFLSAAECETIEAQTCH